MARGKVISVYLIDGEANGKIKASISNWNGIAYKIPSHVPAKTSTRERVVEVWAQQRVLDGAFGVGRFLCLLTCIGETNFYSKDMSVALTCVPNQWINYQLFIAQIKRAYYLDVPGKYDELNNRFPKINVKKFGEFFHESNLIAE